MLKQRTKILTAAIPAIAMASAMIALPAQARTSGKNCWGVVSAQLAKVEGGIGEHSSSQGQPRLGLGNVARLFFEMGLIDSPHVSDLGSLLAQLDPYDDTVCPIQ